MSNFDNFQSFRRIKKFYFFIRLSCLLFKAACDTHFYDQLIVSLGITRMYCVLLNQIQFKK